MTPEVLEILGVFIEMLQARERVDRLAGRSDKGRMTDPQRQMFDDLLGRRNLHDSKIMRYAEKWLKHSKVPDASTNLMCELIGLQPTPMNNAFAGLALVHLSMLVEACGGKIVWDPQNVPIDIEKYRRAIALLRP